jgi:DNA-binding HxlR family transcriptional regulator
MSATHTRVPALPAVAGDCPTREVLDRVGDKWSVMVVVLLGQRTHRFS